MLGLVYIGVLYSYSIPTEGTIHGLTWIQFLILQAIVCAIFIFAIVSILKKESKIGAITIILADFLLFLLAMFGYKGLDPWL